jgi:hypothetical protein
MDVQLQRVKWTTRLMELWMIAIIAGITTALMSQSSVDTFYTFGPSSTFIILGITIDTPLKYSIVVLYSVLDTLVTALLYQVVTPWLTLVVHDTTVVKTHLSYFLIHEISIISRIYAWVDWLLYINILLSQIDVALIQLLTDALCTIYITYVYLDTSVQEAPAIEMAQTDTSASM